jgi:hypothetical protein
MEYAGVALIPLVIGISEVLKKTGFNAKYIPVINLVLGLTAGMAILNPSDVRAGIIEGLFIGLSASGLYSGTKNLTQEIQRSRRERINK